MRHRTLLGLLTVSGFAGLAYEVLWVRLLASSFGSTTLSFSTILAVFFGGLALGARLAGPRARALRDPVRAYGWIEAAIGACGLLLYPLLKGLPAAFAVIDPGPGLAGAAVRLAVSLPILLVPTVLMGATLPVVMAGVVRRDDDVGRGSALIYGFNTLGACLGAYTVTFWLLPALGVWGATVFTVALNFAVAGLVLRKRWVAPNQPNVEVRSGSDRVSVGLRVAGGLALVSGLAAILLQVVWVRVFSIVLNGSVYAVGSVLIVVLLGIAIGSIGIARRIGSSSDSSSTLATWFVALQATSVLALVVLFALMPRLAFELRNIAGAAGTIDTIHIQLIVVFAALIVPTSTAGASFPVLLALAERRAKAAPDALGRLYAVNTVGSITGSLLGGFVLIPAVGSQWVAGIAVALLAVNGVVGAFALAGARGRPLRLGMAAVAVASLLAYDGFAVRQLAHKSDRATWSRHRTEAEARVASLVFFEETHSVTVSVRETGPDRSLRLNGLGQGRYSLAPPQHSPVSVLVALVPLVHRPQPGRGLLVGLGAGVTLDVLVKLGVPELRVVELEAAVAEAARVIFRGHSPVDSPGVDLVIDDARQYLLLAQGRGDPKWDFITSMPAHPWVAPNIFTREFFDVARANLAADGVFCTWFGGEVHGTRLDTASAESVVRAFAQSFEHWAAYFVPEVGSYFLVGSGAPLRIHPAATARLGQSRVLRDHARIADPMFLARHRVAAGWPGTKVGTGPVNTDDSAYVETHAPRTNRAMSALDPGFTSHSPWAPEMIDAPYRATFFIELVEEQLGTPQGRPSAWPVRPAEARRTLRGVEAAVSAAEYSYLDARIRAAQGDPEGVERLAAMGRESALGEELRRRSAFFAERPISERSP